MLSDDAEEPANDVSADNQLCASLQPAEDAVEDEFVGDVSANDEPPALLRCAEDAEGDEPADDVSADDELPGSSQSGSEDKEAADKAASSRHVYMCMD